MPLRQVVAAFMHQVSVTVCFQEDKSKASANWGILIQFIAGAEASTISTKKYQKLK